MLNSVVECMDWGGQPTTVSVECERRHSDRNGSHVVSVDELRCMPTTCKTRPAGQVRPATRFCPAREMFLNYNGDRPAACH